MNYVHTLNNMQLLNATLMLVYEYMNFIKKIYNVRAKG